ncbi:DUF6036 family nucleotidyltransferase (plasmid) [Aneurinibacillus sp. Ricciae_BoGa-3]|uniref:DUF6036 family nucleotidyltransferase n=1 Tax=Aneurinibacillus sp. Ricciae_BoGa-3 TaxID=3022697 RepID=UPI0023423778|nr:DUF6036 family nucleotidyltransferase [Aneurinibacillus sp. Ricciae_BoGa-3]WCK57323.1 DUF6036 family nucleotidyltransferase [Aneurinibacillus sp. Ricciae_BoGa-3]
MNTKSEVVENLALADQFISTIFPNLDKLNLVISGGASFLLKGFDNKFTLDIDTVTKLDEDVLLYMESFAINDSASEVTKLSASFRDRLVPFQDSFNVLDVHLLSNEDLVLSKIGRLSQDDLMDIENSGILDTVNVELLTQLALEISTGDMDFKQKWTYFKNCFLEG